MQKYPKSVEWRTMKELEVVLKAIAGEIKWIQAADILGVTARTIRRKHARYKEFGIEGLLDGRKGACSPRRASFELVEKVLHLFREEYFDYNVKHFHEELVRDYGLPYGYTWLKGLLQEAGYIKRKKGRGGHRQRRQRRPVFGQMVHLDGSDHEWLALRAGERQTLLLAVDDATGKNLAARLARGETTKDCLFVMRQVVERYGIPSQLYTDRGSVYWHTSKSGGKVDRENPTQFGRAMNELGVEMIPGYSPQARGRGERWNGTWQGRLVAELRRAGIADMESANAYIEEVFVPAMNREFAVEPKEVGSAFVSAAGADLDLIFSILHKDRRVYNDNTVRVNNLSLQIEKSSFREHFVRCEVNVHEHPDGTYTLVWKKRKIGRFDTDGNSIGEGRPGLSLTRTEKMEKDEKPGSLSSLLRPSRECSGCSPALPYPLTERS